MRQGSTKAALIAGSSDILSKLEFRVSRWQIQPQTRLQPDAQANGERF